MNQYSRVILLCISAVLGFLSNSSSQELEKVRLQLKWHHQFQFAGYYAAREKGYYADAGINVEILEGNKSLGPVTTVLDGNAEFGVTGSDILNHFIEKKPVVVISTVFQHSPYVFITMADRQISTPSDLAGKRVMASNDQGWLFLKAMLKMEGIPSDSVEMIEHSWNNMDLIEGRIDAITAYSTVEPWQFKKLGAEIQMIRPIDYGIDFYGDLLFTSKDLSVTQPELVDKFNEASMLGWQYAMANPEEIVDYILTLPGVRERGITRDNLLFEAQEMRKYILPDLVEIGHINPGRWQRMLDMYVELGIAKKGDSINGLLFESSSERKLAYFNILLYALGIGFSIIVGAILWNWQLRKIVNKKTLDLQKEIAVRKGTEERLEFTMESAGLGVWDWNLNTNEVNYNENWILSMGYNRESFMKGLERFDIVHPDDRENVRENLIALIKGLNPRSNVSYRMRTGDGSWRWIVSFGRVLSVDDENKPLEIIGTHLDIDFLKKNEQELQDTTSELRKKNAELQKFAYITSHNLRAPVVNLMSLTEFQKDDTLPESIQLEITSKIHDCVVQLDATLNDLVKIVASKSNDQLKKENLQLSTEIYSVIRSIETQIKESGATFDIKVPQECTVKFPRQFLNSILLNLMTNALKYRDPERNLVIRIEAIEEADSTILSFGDNGLGMNMEKFGSKIFGLYQRFHANIDGRGLGLYLIKSQIEAMDGKIKVESKPGIGTTFTIHFNNWNAGKV